MHKQYTVKQLKNLIYYRSNCKAFRGPLAKNMGILSLVVAAIAVAFGRFSGMGPDKVSFFMWLGLAFIVLIYIVLFRHSRITYYSAKCADSRLDDILDLVDDAARKGIPLEDVKHD